HFSHRMRRTNMFCDAVLKVEDDEFPIHKVILCSSSSYFRAMFENGDHLHNRDFTIGGISPEVMSLVLDFIYTGNVNLSGSNVQALVLAADMLLLENLVEFCFDYMERHMYPENCIGIWKFSDVIISPTTRHLAWRYILRNFEEVAVCDEFLQLTGQELTSVIETDELNVKSEAPVFDAIVHWTNHALEERKGEFPQLLTKVRLSLMTFSYMRRNVMQNALVETNYDCMNTVVEAMEVAHNVFAGRRFSNPLLRPRLPGAILLAIGGWSGGDPTNGIEAYDCKANRWVDVTIPEERPRAYHGAVFLDGSVYCVGGFDRMEHFSSVRRLDMRARTWHEMAPMYHRRCYVSVTVLHDRIYAMGGYNGQVRLSAAEVFDPKANRWSLIAPMSEQRSDANCATFNDEIYICGGFNGRECLQTAECYSPETNQWNAIAPMITRRSGVAVIAHANKIYAVGGFDGNVRLRSVEAYNPSTRRCNFGIEVLDDRIFVAGGFNGFTTIDDVECYDLLLDKWTRVRDMGILRSALTCCVISGLPNMSDYAVSRDALPVLVMNTESSDEEPN
uniref:Kelch like family member 10 n=1 Tax=Neogobius melanostomus TaxID=47308 RepID=A0A8C6T135_9GOBI